MTKAATLQQKSPARIEFLKFSLVGVANTAVDLGLYIMLTRLIFFFGEHILVAKALSFIAATICSFTLNRTWTFAKKDPVRIKEVLKFYSTVGSGIFINVAAVYFFHEMLGVNDILSAVFAAGFTVFWGFAFSKFWVFKN